MKIATWNVERLKHQKSLARITAACERVRADILVLTETDSRIRPDYRYCFSTPTPPDIGLPGYEEPLHYRPTEHRVSLFTNYKCIRQHPTFDRHTALCVELETEMGAARVRDDPRRAREPASNISNGSVAAGGGPQEAQRGSVHLRRSQLQLCRSLLLHKRWQRRTPADIRRKPHPPADGKRALLYRPHRRFGRLCFRLQDSC